MTFVIRIRKQNENFKTYGFRFVQNETLVWYEIKLYQMKFHFVWHNALRAMGFYITTYKKMIWYVIWYTVSLGLSTIFTINTNIDEDCKE